MSEDVFDDDGGYPYDLEIELEEPKDPEGPHDEDDLEGTEIDL